MFFKKKRTQVDENATVEALRSLALRLSITQDNTLPPRMVAFIAARAGEGSTTVALNYASLLARESGRKVLILDTSPSVSKLYGEKAMSDRVGIIDAAINSQPVEMAFCEIEPKLYVARWARDKNNRVYAERVIRSEEFWKRLFSEFNTVVVDSPSLQSSFEGVALANKADATVMVVEAEATPAPVVQKLRSTLESAGVKIAGVVLNKRRFYIPQKAYSKL